MCKNPLSKTLLPVNTVCCYRLASIKSSIYASLRELPVLLHVVITWSVVWTISHSFPATVFWRNLVTCNGLGIFKCHSVTQTAHHLFCSIPGFLPCVKFSICYIIIWLSICPFLSQQKEHSCSVSLLHSETKLWHWHSHLFIFYLQRGQARLQLVVAHQEFCLDRLLCTHLTHLGLRDKGNFIRRISQREQQTQRDAHCIYVPTKQTILIALFSSDPPHPPCVADSQSVQEDRRSGCACP